MLLEWVTVLKTGNYSLIISNSGAKVSHISDWRCFNFHLRWLLRNTLKFALEPCNKVGRCFMKLTPFNETRMVLKQLNMVFVVARSQFPRFLYMIYLDMESLIKVTPYLKFEMIPWVEIDQPLQKTQLNSMRRYLSDKFKNCRWCLCGL